MSIVTRRSAITGLGIALATPPLATPPLASPALAQSGDVFRIGLILPMTGPFASTGRQIEAAIRAWLRANPAPIAGKRIEILLRDDTGVAPDVTRRLAQELAVRERVQALAGFGLTPLALAAAPIATEAKLPMIVMAAATAIIPRR
jgi:branched-chain amino acid transport system substrate-binding protein